MDPATRFRYPHEFSGGQRQRISIARAVVLERISSCWMSRPARSICCSKAQMVDLLRELQRKRDLTYMFISHDLRVVAFARKPPDRDAAGQGRGGGTGSELFQRSEDDYTRPLFAAAFRLETAPATPSLNSPNSA